MKRKILFIMFALVCTLCCTIGLIACGDGSKSDGDTVAVTSVTLNKTQLSLAVGGSETLTATVMPTDATNKTVSWSSDKPSVASVSNGTVTAKAYGTATITATAGGKSATCSVTVGDSNQPDSSDYTVKFETNGGDAIDDIKVKKGESLTLPTPTRENYVFDGWYTNSGFSGDALEGLYTPTKDVTLYAKWTPEAAEFKYLQFTLNGDTYSVSAKENAVELTALSIPDTYRKKAVTEIESEGFVICTNLESLAIPQGVVSIGASAFEGCSKLKNLTIAESVTEIGAYAFAGCRIERAEIPLTALNTISVSELKNAIILNGEEITSNNFSACTNLESLVLPESVNSIAKGAFSNCNKLEQITVPFVGASESNTSNTHFGYIFGADDYYGNRNAVPQTLKDINILGGKIAKWAFLNCRWIENLTIGDSVTDIADYAFQGCRALEETVISDNVNSIGKAVFADCGNIVRMTLPYVGSSVNDTDNTLGYFFGTKSYIGSTQVTQYRNYYYIPSGLTTITLTGGSLEYYTFSGCKSLTEVNLPDNLTYIGYSVFNGCTALKSITIPDSVEELDNYALNGCTSITSIHIPRNLAKIGSSALAGLTELNEITVDPANTTYRSEGNCLIAIENSQIILGTKSSTIPDGIISISSNAFSGTKIKSVTIPSSVVSIGMYSFSNCAELESVTMTQGLKSVFMGAFNNCTSLKSLTFPEGMTYLDDSIYNCTSITSVTIPSTLTRCGSNFYNCDNLKLNEYNNALYIGNSSNPYLVLVRAKDTSITSCTVHADTVIIAENAFSGCRSLKSVTLGNKIKTIEDSAFYSCTSLTSISLPASIEILGSTPFRNCTSLQRITFASEIEDFKPSVFMSSYDNLTGTVYNGAQYSGPSSNPYMFLMKASSKSISSCTIHPDTKFIGEGAFKNCTSLRSIVIPDKVKYIGYDAFNGCTSLSSVTIGKSVAHISSYTFSGCTSLKSITIPENVSSIANDVFSGCTSLESITLPDGLTSISDRAFYNCTALTQVSLGSAITSVSTSAFSGCTALKSITVSADNDTYVSPNGVLYNKAMTRIVALPLGMTAKYAIPDSISTIDLSLFTNLSDSALTSYNNALYIGTESNPYYGLIRAASKAITSCTVHNDTKLINASAFSGCTSLKRVTISDSVISIGASAFYNCTSLAEIKIGSAVTKIESSAFSGCTALTEIAVPDSVISIGASAFYNCTSLAKFTFGGSVESIGSNAFSGVKKLVDVYYNGELFDWCNIVFANETANPLSSSVSGTVTNKLYFNNTLITEMVIPETVLQIGNYVFYGCSSLTKVSFPDTVTSVGNYAFYGCTSLVDVNFSDTITSIGTYAFYNCTVLTSISFPEAMTSIGAYAFRNCTALKSIVITKNITSIGTYAFYNCTALTSVTFEVKSGWYYTYGSSKTNVSVTDSATNATNLKKTYASYSWART